MSFKLLQLLARWAFRYYYRTIHFLGEAQFPEGQPVLVAANHSNSAADAMFLSAISSRHIHWLARADVFKHKLIAKVMSFVHTAPIYRASEYGVAEGMKKNVESFEYCFKLLAKNECIGIFPEGITIHERVLQKPFKKGAARLAFQAHEAIGKPVFVMPVGVSYRSLIQPRTQVFVKFGPSFSTEAYYQLYKENQTQALKEFTEHCEQVLDNEVISYDKVKDQTALNVLLDIQQNNLYAMNQVPHGIVRDPKLFVAEHKLVNQLITWQQQKPAQVQELYALAQSYAQNLSLHHATDVWVLTGRLPMFRYIKGAIYAICKFLARIIYFLPNTLIKKIISNRVKKVEFHTSVRYTLGLILFTIYPMLLALLVKITIGFSYWISLSVLLGITYCGLRGLNYLPTAFLQPNKSQLPQLRQQRDHILSLLAE
jgi:1-acyl-sn-glycerol-3-phosphate acyltransferase